MDDQVGDLDGEIARLRKELAREGAARAEAEAVATRALQQLNDNHRGLELLQVITVAANQAVVITEAVQIALDRICEYTGWEIGHGYLTAEDGSVDLVPLDVWHGEESQVFTEFRGMTQGTRLTAGMGLAGRVFKSGKASWVRNIREDEIFAEAGALRALEVKSAFGFPLMIGPGVAGGVGIFFAVRAGAGRAVAEDHDASGGRSWGG